MGIAADPQFASSTFQLERNDLVEAYTDGITEAQNRQGDFWAQQRLEDLLLSSGHKIPAQVIEDVLNEVKKFGDGQPQHDDIALVVLRVQAGYRV